jgi:hypothetical protein
MEGWAGCDAVAALCIVMPLLLHPFPILSSSLLSYHERSRRDMMMAYARPLPYKNPKQRSIMDRRRLRVDLSFFPFLLPFHASFFTFRGTFIAPKLESEG